MDSLKSFVPLKKIASFDELKEGEIGIFEDDLSYGNNLFTKINDEVKMIETTVFLELN